MGARWDSLHGTVHELHTYEAGWSKRLAQGWKKPASRRLIGGQLGDTEGAEGTEGSSPRKRHCGLDARARTANWAPSQGRRLARAERPKRQRGVERVLQVGARSLEKCCEKCLEKWLERCHRRSRRPSSEVAAGEVASRRPSPVI